MKVLRVLLAIVLLLLAFAITINMIMTPYHHSIFGFIPWGIVVILIAISYVLFKRPKKDKQIS